MPKRKRSSETSLQQTLDKASDEVFRALKAAKGFERQRLSKRLRDAGVTPDKQERLDREVTVLKVWPPTIQPAGMPRAPLTHNYLSLSTCIRRPALTFTHAL